MYVDRWLAAFRRRVGEHGSPTHHRFYWLTEEEMDRSPCRKARPGAVACAFGRHATIYSPLLPIEHEVVHVELTPEAGHPLLTEGAAELFGSIAASSTTEAYSVAELVDGEYLHAPAYTSAGRFSRYLYEQHGSDAYFELFDAAVGVDDEAGLAAAFDRTLGVTLDEAIADYDTYAACDPPRWRFHDYECEDLALSPWASVDLWQDTVALDCAAPDVIGPRRDLGTEGPDKIWTLRALEVSEAGPYQLRVEGDAPAVAELQPCSGNCFDDDGVTVVGIRATTEAASPIGLLLPGRYWMRIERDANDSGEVVVSLERGP